MSIRFLRPPTSGWVESQLEKPHMNFLWKAIDNAKKKNVSHKNKLVGHLTNSFELEDEDGWFMQNVLYQNIDMFVQSNFGQHPLRSYSLSSENDVIVLGKMWVNYQYQTEFNPYHNHAGVYSFVIWMKIPYSCEAQRKIKLVQGMKEQDKKAGIFEFEYVDMLGQISNFPYYMEPELEGTMLFFPAGLKHCVYPFYECNEPRISISGNLYISSKPQQNKIITDIHHKDNIDFMKNIIGSGSIK